MQGDQIEKDSTLSSTRKSDSIALLHMSLPIPESINAHVPPYTW